MSRKVMIGIGLIVVIGIAAVAISVLRPSAEASAPIAAPTVSVQEPVVQEEPTEAVEEPEQVEANEAPSAGDAVIFAITQDESEVRFSVDEILNNAPFTAVGVSNQVAGEIVIDLGNTGQPNVGSILINARTLKTDSEFRNRAINNSILNTNQYEFITFNPTAIAGFPENPRVGDEISFHIIGDLTIRDITNEETFDVQVIAVSDQRLEGYASAVVLRSNYDLTIPEVPRVAGVDDDVLLEIDFVALAK